MNWQRVLFSLSVKGIMNAKKLERILNDILFARHKMGSRDLNEGKELLKILVTYGPLGIPTVAILLKENSFKSYNRIHIDPNGRYIVIDLQTDTENFRLINMYVPNNEYLRKMYFINFSNL